MAPPSNALFPQFSSDQSLASVTKLVSWVNPVPMGMNGNSSLSRFLMDYCSPFCYAKSTPPCSIWAKEREQVLAVMEARPTDI
ncbi:hypothetical protein V6N11_004934 [Hibiscus sabdariffa]|uniref:Uncharacterized protein n=1 Tax=Hibiscus sabdariffa TaxID=183260 RepID=A0ABR2SHP2_9ROSI